MWLRTAMAYPRRWCVFVLRSHTSIRFAGLAACLAWGVGGSRYGARVQQTLSVLPETDLARLRALVGETSYARGAAYARQARVLRVLWDQDAGMLLGTVRGSAGKRYTTTVELGRGTGRSWAVVDGVCSCPVGLDCKHVAAVVLAAVGVGKPTSARPPKPRVSWEQSLGPLVESGQPLASGTSIALELALAHVAGEGREPRLMARLVRPGKRGGWAAGNLSWSRLSTLNYYRHEESFDETHVRLLRELYALYTTRGTAGSPYSYGHSSDVNTIDLSTVESTGLWPLLERARASELRLVHARKHLGDVEPAGVADLCLDVTGSSGLAVRPVLGVDGEDAGEVVAARFFGTAGHGLVYVTKADMAASADPGLWRIRLARLERPAPPPLQRMALSGQRLEIPADEVGRFRDEFYPRLRRAATVISSDDSFTPPEITGPTLTLRAEYGTDHELDLAWEWAYRVGETSLRVGLDQPDDPGYRDLAAEGAVLADLAEPLDEYGLREAAGSLVPRSRLGGIDTMRFSTEALPLLADHGVAVEVGGRPADYREVSDSLVIGVSTAEVAGETDWFDLGVTISVEGTEVPFAQVFAVLAAGESHLMLADGGYFALDKPELVRLRTLIEEARALTDRPGDELRISRFQAGLFDELAELGVVHRQSQAWQRQVEGLRAIRTVEVQALPAALDATLRPYQAEGFSWLALLWRHGLGGILADDMGLGKTVQSLALISHAKAAGERAPFLVVAPSSVVSNWAAEAGRFAPGLRVVAITDTLRRSGADLGELVADADVVVTSYTLFRLDFAAHAGQGWAGLILDEAQFVKNHQGKTYQCARKLAAPFKLAITGTPMENNVMELWSLLSITAPGLFPSPTRFADYYARPIEKGSDAELLAQLRRRIKPLVKRRTKEQVAADLPAKQEQVLEVALHPKHRTAYQRRLQRERQKVLGLLEDVTKNRFTILRSLTVLRQLSLHAGLVDDAHNNMPCAKLDALLEQLADVASGGHRALVFSQFTGFLAKVRARLDADGIEYCYLDGKTRKRADVIQRFKDGDAPVFLISLKAGGFGLNLTEADYCFLLDPWWNPATEAQAVDRTHRIGQTRNVMVYRLISADTIEEKVMALKQRKAELFASVMDDGNAFGSTLTADDIRGLLQ